MSLRQLTLDDYAAEQAEAQRRKDEGMQRAWDHSAEWAKQALPVIRDWLLTQPDGAIVTADDWRLAELVPEPDDPRSTWGAFAGHLARRGWVTWTGRLVRSRQKRGHCNPLREWRINRAALLSEDQQDAA